MTRTDLLELRLALVDVADTLADVPVCGPLVAAVEMLRRARDLVDDELELAVTSHGARRTGGVAS